MRVLLAFALIFGLLLSSAPSSAATVNAVQGQVLLNRGQGYQLLQGSADANPGDTVVVNPGGSAQIVYPDGCVVDVQPLSVVAIAPQPPCQTGQSAVNGTTIAIGAVVLGGGIAAAVLLSQKDKAASP